MKKIFLCFLILLSLSYGGAITWLGTSASAKTAANWVDGALPQPIDTALYGGTNNVACTYDTSFGLSGYHCPAAYTANITWSGQTFECAGPFIDSGAGGTRNYGNGLTLWGKSIFATQLGTVTATGTTLYLPGNNDSMISFKAITFGHVKVGYPGNTFTIRKPTGSFYAQGTTCPFYFMGGTTVLSGSFIISNLTGTDSCYHFENGSTVNIVTRFQCQLNAANIVGYVQKIKCINTGILEYIGGATSPAICTFQQLDTIDARTNKVALTNGNATGRAFYYTNSKPIYCLNFDLGSNNATGTATQHLGQSHIRCYNDFLMSLNTTGKDTLYFDTARINIARSITANSQVTIKDNLAKVIFDSSLTAVYTMLNNKIHVIEIAKTSSAKFTATDTITTDSLVLTTGRDSLLTVRTADWVNNNTDSTYLDGNTYISRNYSRSSLANKLKRLSGKLYFNGSTDGTFQADTHKISFVLKKDAGKTLTLGADVSAGKIQDTSGILNLGIYNLRVDTLIMAAGNKIAIAALKNIDIRTYTAGDISGATDSFVSVSPGTKCTLKIAGKPTIAGLYLSGDVVYTDTTFFPVIDSVYPGYGSADGGYWVTIKGKYFGNLSTVNWGGTPCDTYQLKNDSIVICNSMAMTDGPIKIILTNNNGDTTSTLFISDSSMHLGISATKDISSGPVGATVTFTGSGFVGACWVKFGTDSSALTVNAYTDASAPVPLGLAPGVYAVVVGNSDGDVASVGNFTVESGTVLCTLTIAAGANGTVNPTGAQSDTCGDLLLIAAQPNAGFQFQKWTRSGTTATVTDSAAASTTVRRNDSAAGAVTITANFVKKQFNLHISAFPDKGVIVPAKGDTLVDSNSTITISQTPSDTNTFLGWTVSGGVTIAGDSLSITVRGDGSLTARYSSANRARKPSWMSIRTKLK